MADDFGLTGPVSRAILTLGEAGRLSGAGAMTGLPAFAPHARAFADLAGTMDIGLHVTLTLGAPLGPMPVLAPGGVLPSFRDLARLDPVVATRPQEFAYLSGPGLPEDLAEARMRIIRLGDLSSS